MLDANGREIRVGDWVATPYPPLAEMPTAEMMAVMPAIIKGAVLGQVVEIFTEYWFIKPDGEPLMGFTEPIVVRDGGLARALGKLYAQAFGAVPTPKHFVHLGDGILCSSEDIVTLSGFEWVTCLECGEAWPFDVRMNTEEECPACDCLLTWAEWDHLISGDEPYEYDDMIPEPELMGHDSPFDGWP